MDKILAALKKLLPEDQVSEVATAVNDMLSEAKTAIEEEYNEKLTEAYSELSEEIAQVEKIGYEGYQAAAGMIRDLGNRLETQNEEFEAFMQENYKEAHRMIEEEKSKNSDDEVRLYEEFDTKLKEMKEYIVDKVDQFLQFKGGELYENVKREVLNDPRMAEHKVVLDRIIENVQDFISDEEYSYATNSKVDQLAKTTEDLKGQIKILEARNIKLSTNNSDMVKQLREANEKLDQNSKLLSESAKNERVAKAEKASGRGQKVVLENDEAIVKENKEPVVTPKTNLVKESTISELQILAGIKRD